MSKAAPFLHIPSRGYDQRGEIPAKPAKACIGFCLAEEGREYLVYPESGGSVSVKIKPAHPKGYAVRWINARETKDARDGGLTTMGENPRAPDAGDWLPRLTAAARAGR